MEAAAEEGERVVVLDASGLAYDLTPTLWNNVFSEANDGIVPLRSQLNATGSTHQHVSGRYPLTGH